MFTTTTETPNKKIDTKELVKDLKGVSPDVLADFQDGLEFGIFQDRYKIIWKHGSPWRYPAHQYPMLKTLIRVKMLSDYDKTLKERYAKTDVAQALGIAEETKEKNKAVGTSMSKFFKDLG